MKKYLKYSAISLIACAFLIGCSGANNNVDNSDNDNNNDNNVDNNNVEKITGLKSPNQISIVDAKEEE
jgi:PBP1b-binding outer membrane lipoprotein LpoB